MFCYVLCLSLICCIVEGSARDITANDGEVAELRCSSGAEQESIESCIIKLPGLPPQQVGSYSSSCSNDDRTQYLYNTYVSGHTCTGEIIVTEMINGVGVCYIRPRRMRNYLSNNFTITVLRPPTSLELFSDAVINDRLDASVGEKVTVTCKSKGGRPGANLTFFIDDEIPTTGLSTQLIENLEGDLYTVSQNLTFIIKPTHHGNAVKCIASHPARTEDEMKMINISVLFPPRSSIPNPATIYDLPEGQEATLALIIEANPRPECVWLQNDTHIQGVEVIPGFREVGKFKYMVTLKISSMDKDLDNIPIYVNCSNSIGKYEQVFELSTQNHSIELNYDGLQPFYGPRGKTRVAAMEGEMVVMTCKSTVKEPLASLEWLLDNEPITTGLSILAIEKLHGNVNKISQKLTFTAQKSHDKKIVKCIASHPSWTREKELKILIDVEEPQEPIELDFMVYQQDNRPQ